MSDQYPFGARFGQDIRLDDEGPGAHVRGDVSGQMTHAGMKDVTLSRPMHAGSILGEARAEAIVQGQHLAALRLGPP